MNFTQLGLNDEIVKAVQEVGYQKPSPIQARAIPLILKGRDVIGQAQTGTGKTAAFSLPIIQNVSFKKRFVQALIVSPTRELAMQTQKAVTNLGQTKHVDVQAVYGGSNVGTQIKALKRHPQIIVGTPGRILDLLHREALDLSSLNYLVLDEADDMLNMGFLPDIKKIVVHVSTSRQTLLFSATMPDSIRNVGTHFMKDPKEVSIEPRGLTTALIDQYYVRTPSSRKFAALVRFLDVEKPQVTIVFCQTKRRVNDVTRGLIKCGFRAAGLQGDLSQNQRSKVMNDFKFHQIDILVATNVAARGIDVNGVTHVFNFDIPQDPDEYVHRIGRTGRAGHRGVSITLTEPRQIRFLRQIERLTKVKMMPLKIPSKRQAWSGRLVNAEIKVAKLVKHVDSQRFSGAADELLGRYGSKDLISVLLKMLTRSQVRVHVAPEPSFHRNRKHHHFRHYHHRRHQFRGRCHRPHK